MPTCKLRPLAFLRGAIGVQRGDVIYVGPAAYMAIREALQLEDGLVAILRSIRLVDVPLPVVIPADVAQWN